MDKVSGKISARNKSGKINLEYIITGLRKNFVIYKRHTVLLGQ